MATKRRVKNATIGVVLLDSDHYTREAGRFGPSDEVGLGRLPRGFFECPASWSITTEFAVAEDASARAVIGGERRALEGLERALTKLASKCDVVVANCGFFWAARKSMPSDLPAFILLSGLDFLDMAALSNGEPIGILTYSERDAYRLLRDHPLVERLRIVGVDDLEGWSHLIRDDYATVGDWGVDQLRTELTKRVSQEFRGGKLHDVGSVIIECTAMPQFLADLHELISVPMFDIATFATNLVGVRFSTSTHEPATRLKSATMGFGSLPRRSVQP